MAYVTVSQVRAAGLAEAVATDAAVEGAIAGWTQYIDRFCDQFFEPREATVVLDGTDSDTLHFGVPIIEITSLKLNNSLVPLDPANYRVYNRRQAPADDRRNPRIKLIRNEDHRDIYSAPMVIGHLKFRKGRQNQEVTGTFGFTEPDGSVPYLIQRALILLVVEKLTKPIVPDPLNPIEAFQPLGPILEEVTDGHKIKYQQAGGVTKARPAGLLGITENREVHDALKLYKAPLRMASPANWSYT